MEKNTLKLSWRSAAAQLVTPETKGSKEIRRLIIQLERRERERDRQRDERARRKAH